MTLRKKLCVASQPSMMNITEMLPHHATDLGIALTSLAVGLVVEVITSNRKNRVNKDKFNSCLNATNPVFVVH